MPVPHQALSRHGSGSGNRRGRQAGNHTRTCRQRGRLQNCLKERSREAADIGHVDPGRIAVDVAPEQAIATRKEDQRRSDRKRDRRQELQSRMHERRERDFGVGYGRSSGYASKRESYVRSWRPGSFRVG